jgi:hypothetical protein
MKLYLTTNNENFIDSASIYNINGIEYTFENEDSYQKFLKDFSNGDTFYLENEKIVNKTIKYDANILNIIGEKESKIHSLKSELKNTDYQIIKCFEAFISNKNMPYDYDALENKRIT